MLNKVELIGNVGHDPEVKKLDVGHVATFSLATTEYYKDKNSNPVEQVEWHNIVVWNKLADIAEKYIKKGARIYMEGRIRTRSWESESGKNYRTEIIGKTIKLLSTKTPSGEYKEQEQNIDEALNEDLPF